MDDKRIHLSEADVKLLEELAKKHTGRFADLDALMARFTLFVKRLEDKYGVDISAPEE
jgi:hypothetical protein